MKKLLRRKESKLIKSFLTILMSVINPAMPQSSKLILWTSNHLIMHHCQYLIQQKWFVPWKSQAEVRNQVCSLWKTYKLLCTFWKPSGVKLMLGLRNKYPVISLASLYQCVAHMLTMSFNSVLWNSSELHQSVLWNSSLFVLSFIEHITEA